MFQRLSLAVNVRRHWKRGDICCLRHKHFHFKKRKSVETGHNAMIISQHTKLNKVNLRVNHNDAPIEVKNSWHSFRFSRDGLEPFGSPPLEGCRVVLLGRNYWENKGRTLRRSCQLFRLRSRRFNSYGNSS